MEEYANLEGGLLKISYREMTVAIGSTDGKVTLLSNEAINIFPQNQLLKKRDILIQDFLFSDREVSEFSNFIDGSLKMNTFSSCLLQLRTNIYLWFDYFPYTSLHKSSLNAYFRVSKAMKRRSFNFSCWFLNSLFSFEKVDDLLCDEVLTYENNSHPTIEISLTDTYPEIELYNNTNLDFDFEFGDIFEWNTVSSDKVDMKSPSTPRRLTNHVLEDQDTMKKFQLSYSRHELIF
mmetsp:Transcript_34589/g.35268  ORF Transcript_34589/g.35268 Transcript_34589/m.35268 type:complete len:234 (+) Transcript_34589:82-783(+)